MIDPATDIQKTLLADFGEPVTVDGATVTARFVAPFDQVDVGEGVVNTTAPQVHLPASVAVGEGSVVEARGVTYTVIGPPLETGLGLLICHLTEAV